MNGVASRIGERPRRLRIGGRRTSMRLESEFWEALREIAWREATDIGSLRTGMTRHTRGRGTTSAVRVAVMEFYRQAVALDRPPAIGLAHSLPAPNGRARRHRL
ncbi:MAG: ribbon-helix-helix domain-containing protein [Pseudomonadota bacterium]